MARRKSKKRPCRICRKWFTPNPRVGDRQKTCGNPDCKQKWRKKKCAEWNSQNRKCAQESYLYNKLINAISQSNGVKQPSTVTAGSKPLPAVTQTANFLKLPRTLIQEVIGVQHFVIIEYVSQQLLRTVQEAIRNQVPDNKGDSQQLLPSGVQEVIGSPPDIRIS